MIATEGITRKIIGSIDLLFLLPRGIAAFRGDKKTAIRTLVIIELLLAPLIPITAAMVPPVGMESYGYSQILFTTAAHYLITFIVSMAFSWQVAGLLEMRERFWLGIEAGAWVNLVATLVIMLPLLLLDHNGIIPHSSMERIYTGLAIYSFIIGGCITYAVYRINLFLVIGLGMAGLFIDRETWSLLYAMQGIQPLP